MKPPKEPAGGWPWKQPGFRFWTPGFPPGYEPTGRLERDLSLTASQSRDKRVAAGTEPKEIRR